MARCTIPRMTTLTVPHLKYPTRPMTSCYVIHCREHIFRLITSQNDIKYISRQVTKHADHAPNTCNSLIVCQGCCACHCKRLIPITLGLTKRGSWSLTSSDLWTPRDALPLGPSHSHLLLSRTSICHGV